MKEKVSVLVIAHNEEKYIKKCINSILNQTRKPDEVVVIAHNCTDGTQNVLENFSQEKILLKIVNHDGPEGVVYARKKGFEEVSGDIIACIDGDSYASENWLKKITNPLIKNKEMGAVGGLVLFYNSFFANLWSLTFFFTDRIFRPTYHFYFWGANFACRKKTYDEAGGLKPLFELKNKMNLNFWAEDLYLSLLLERRGRIVFKPSAIIYSVWKGNHPLKVERGNKQQEDRLKFLKYFGNHIDENTSKCS